MFHVLALAAATVAYRVSPLHPLARFPGPAIHRCTSLKNAWVTSTGRRHLYIDALHQQYGRIVRIGPDALSINDSTAVGPIYAAANAMDKNASYTFGGAKGKGLFFMKEREEHNFRRRMWAGAFSEAKEWFEVLERRTLELQEVLQSRADADKCGVVDLRQALCHWTYDVMGDITFGNSSQVNMLRDGDPEDVILTGHLATIVLEVVGEIPSLFSLLWYLPAGEKMRALEQRAARWMAQRAAADPLDARQDIASYLLEKDESTGATLLGPDDLTADAILAVQAGSDTPAGILTYLFFFLLWHPNVHALLYRELFAAFPTADAPLLPRTLATLPYLDAVITETLRLGAPFHGLPRVVPPAGAALAGEFVPPGTTVSVPSWSRHLDPAHFGPDPLIFRPERWLDGSADRAALMTFSFGPFGCIGKPLAIAELQVCLVRTVLTYELAFAPSFDIAAFRAGALNIRTPVFRHPLRIMLSKRV
ncbi:cytochrome P450 [Vararia minispora EC-137]|uniref:Cytochrome P450 n=1 Tax=Vararia minispora EC-137 TaxID=1314806 RepID=A0ACB8QAS4_9AGAM|nr:cytochrome P450 [Vararia minispora EC-137]